MYSLKKFRWMKPQCQIWLMQKHRVVVLPLMSRYDLSYVGPPQILKGASLCVENVWLHLMMRRMCVSRWRDVFQRVEDWQKTSLNPTLANNVQWIWLWVHGCCVTCLTHRSSKWIPIELLRRRHRVRRVTPITWVKDLSDQDVVASVLVKIEARCWWCVSVVSYKRCGMLGDVFERGTWESVPGNVGANGNSAGSKTASLSSRKLLRTDAGKIYISVVSDSVTVWRGPSKIITSPPERH